MKTLNFGREEIKKMKILVTDRYGLMWRMKQNERWTYQETLWRHAAMSQKSPENHENQHFLQSHWFSLHHSVCEKAKKWKKFHPDHSHLHSACNQLIILEIGGFHTTGLVLRHLAFLTLCMCVLCYFMLYTHPCMRNMWHEAVTEIYNGIW